MRCRALCLCCVVFAAANCNVPQQSCIPDYVAYNTRLQDARQCAAPRGTKTRTPHRNAQNRIVRRERIFILQLCVESPPSVLNMTLPAFVDKRQRLQHGALSYQSISAAYAGAQHSAANAPAVVAAVDRWDRRTDGRTPDRYIDLLGILRGQRQ